MTAAVSSGLAMWSSSCRVRCSTEAPSPTTAMLTASISGLTAMIAGRGSGSTPARGSADPVGGGRVGLLHEAELDELGDEGSDGGAVESGERGEVGPRGPSPAVDELEHGRKVSTTNRVDGVSEGCHEAHPSA